MTTARSIVEQAARKIHVLGRGSTLSAGEAQDALTCLNNMLGMFSIEGGLLYNQVKETFNLTGATSYTIGVGGNFNTAAPIEIDAVYASDGETDYPLVQIGSAEYAAFADKDTDGLPEFFYYANNAPLGTIYIYPASSASYTLTILSRKALTSFSDLTTDYTLPTGMETMLVHNLAVQLAPEYEKEAAPTVQTIARQTKAAILGANKRHNYPSSPIDPMLQGESDGNIYNGWTR